MFLRGGLLGHREGWSEWDRVHALEPAIVTLIQAKQYQKSLEWVEGHVLKPQKALGNWTNHIQAHIESQVWRHISLRYTATRLGNPNATLEWSSARVLTEAWHIVQMGKLERKGREIEVFGNAYTRAATCPLLDHELNHKPNLARHVQALVRQKLLDSNAFPETFLIPEQSDAAKAAMRNQTRAKRDTCWVLKPAALSNTEGIRFVDSSGISSLPAKDKSGDDWVLQRYVPTPLLVKGHKFDIRVYVVVHSVLPLELYLYKDGLSRYASEPWEGGCETGSVKSWRRATHFTALYPQPNSCAGLRTIQQLWQHLEETRGADTGQVWASIRSNIRDLFWGLHDRVVRQRPAYHHAIQQRSDLHDVGGVTCDKIYGLDILIDDDLQPWFLEVNESPDMGFYSDTDKEVKGGAMRGLVALVAGGGGGEQPPEGYERLSPAAR